MTIEPLDGDPERKSGIPSADEAPAIAAAGDPAVVAPTGKRRALPDLSLRNLVFVLFAGMACWTFATDAYGHGWIAFAGFLLLASAVYQAPQEMQAGGTAKIQTPAAPPREGKTEVHFRTLRTALVETIERSATESNLDDSVDSAWIDSVVWRARAVFEAVPFPDDAWRDTCDSDDRGHVADSFDEGIDLIEAFCSERERKSKEWEFVVSTCRTLDTLTKVSRL